MTHQAQDGRDELLSVMWELTPNYILLLDGDECICRLSPSLARALGRSEDDLVGRPIAEMAVSYKDESWPPPDTDNPWAPGLVLQIAAASGVSHLVHVDAAIEISGPDGPHLLLMMRPMSDRLIQDYETIRQYELDAIREVSSAVTEAPDLDAILQIALDKAVDILYMDCGMVALFGEDHELVRLAACRNLDRDVLGDTVKITLGQGIIGTMLATGEPVLIPDLQQSDIITRVRGLGFRSVAAVPIILRGEPVGALMVGAHRPNPKPRQWHHRTANLLRVLAMQISIGVDYARLFQQEAQRARQLEAAVQELHHRVKNNLETLSAMLELARDTESESHLADRLLERVQAMAAVHGLMQEGGLGEHVDVGDLVAQVASLIGDGSGYRERSATLTVTADHCMLPGRVATPLALITGELVANALQHAFTGPGGEIKVSLACGRGEVRLCVADNGVGMGKGRSARQHATGLRIVEALAEHSLGGRLTIRRHLGTRISVVFPVPSDAANPADCRVRKDGGSRRVGA